MAETVNNRNEFTAESLNVPGFSIIEVGKMKAKSEKFKASADFGFDPDHLVSVLENKGKVYAYTEKKRVKALYVEEKNGNELICNERYLAPELEGTDTAEKLDAQVAFLVAQRASYTKDTSAVFMEKTMPVLKQTSGKFNVAMAIVFAIIYATAFSASFPNKASAISIGICLGISMGFALASHKYYYEE